MATCFPSRAPMVCGKFHRFWNPSAMACHSSGVVGGVITSSIYSSHIAWQTSRTTMDNEFGGMRQPYCSSENFAPEARCLSVTANLSPGSSGDRNLVCCFVRRSSTRLNISLYISGGILMKFLKAVGSSCRSSTISWWYTPNCWRRRIQPLIQTPLLRRPGRPPICCRRCTCNARSRFSWSRWRWRWANIYRIRSLSMVEQVSTGPREQWMSSECLTISILFIHWDLETRWISRFERAHCKTNGNRPLWRRYGDGGTVRGRH